MHSNLARSPAPVLETVDDAASLRPSDYLAANPDVQAAGMDALEHYLTYGKAERRLQLVEPRKIRDLRAEKLARVRFRSEPCRPAVAGEPLDYLPDHIRRSFNIPSVVPISSNAYDGEVLQIIRDNPDAILLDVSAGTRSTYYPNVVNTEIWPSPSTDVICVGEDLPFEDNQFDYIFCLAVLEHTKRPWEACKEIVRVLKPGGHVRIDWPFLQPFHGYPHHFFNATSVGAASLFEDSCEIVGSDTKPWQHPVFALTWILKEWRDGLPSALQAPFAATTIADLLNRSPAELVREPCCQALPPPVQDVISAGTTFTCRKR